jgi:hypothetical protein
MSRDLDEDLIEATIRRVAEAKAAKEAEAPDDDEPEDSLSAGEPGGQTEEARVTMPEPDIDEDAIAATIRRVAEAKAALDARDDALDTEEPTVISHVSPESEPAWEALADQDEEQVFAAAVDEDRIAATIRRIEEQRSVRENDGALADAPAATADADPDVEPEDVTPSPARWEPILVQPTGASVPGTSIESAVAALQDAVDALNRQVAEIERRIGTIASGSPAAPVAPAHSAQSDDDDDWDDEPVTPISRLPAGPPRPAIIRDNPSPMTATAANLEPIDELDDEDESAYEPPRVTPLPAVATASAPQEPARGFDLLPRTYRITVEDKRRSVDLVPLHRALLGMSGVKDMSLLSYANGIAIVSIETTIAIEPDQLCAAVSRAMAREAKVEVHNEQTMVVKLAED